MAQNIATVQAGLQTLLDAVPLPAVLIGQEERIEGANAGALALLGQGIGGRHFITALRQPDVLDAIEGCLRDRARRETRYLTNDEAQDVTYDVSCAYIQTGEISGVLVSFEDITHVKQARQMRRDFVANVSHELRTPLTALMGFIETLQGPARDDRVATERFLGIMQSEAARMERLVRDLLSLSRVESEERMRPDTPVALAPVVQSVLHALTPVAAGTGVTLAFTAPDEPVCLLADADQLRQVVTNLTENAIKYGGPDACVHVSLETIPNEPTIRGPAAVISVRDEGPGIDQVHIPRLTERFYRIDNHRSREMGGTGLGLAIVKHIINRHRGRLRIRSTLGQGSEFRVVLPLDPKG